MKLLKAIFPIAIAVSACQQPIKTTEKLPIEGTWRLISSTTIKPDTTTVDSMKGKEMLKIINATHFSFLIHDLEQGNDSATANFVAGGGSYSLDGKNYHEHLDFCSYRPWEGKQFHFSVSIQNDTLIQKGEEKIEELGVDHILIEKYYREM